MKIITMAFDDGEIYDKELVALLRAHGLKASFGLCCGYLGDGGLLPNGRRYQKVSGEDMAETYAGFELCSHGFYHRDFTALSESELQAEISGDVKAIKKYADASVTGVIYPGGNHNGFVVNTLKELGIKYARTADSLHSFAVPSDFMRWQPTCHILEDNVLSLADTFDSIDGDAVFSVYGHSYELADKESRERAEAVFSRLSGMQNVTFATFGETYSYFTGSKR